MFALKIFLPANSLMLFLFFPPHCLLFLHFRQWPATVEFYWMGSWLRGQDIVVVMCSRSGWGCADQRTTVDFVYMRLLRPVRQMVVSLSTIWLGSRGPDTVELVCIESWRRMQHMLVFLFMTGSQSDWGHRDLLWWNSFGWACVTRATYNCT